MSTHPPLGALRAWSFLTGIVATQSVAALAAFYVFSSPFTNAYSTWSWLGPANDVLTVILAPILSLAAILVWRALAPSRLLAVLTVLLILGQAIGAAVTVLLIARIVDLDAQFAAFVPVVLTMFGWLIAASIIGRRRGRIDAALARWGVVIGLVMPIALGVVAIGFALPTGSAAQWTVFALAGVPGALAWCSYPIWWIVFSFRFDRLIQQDAEASQNFSTSSV